MYYLKSILTVLILSMLLYACRSGNKSNKGDTLMNENEFAKYFSVHDEGDKFELEITDSWSSSEKEVCRYTILKGKPLTRVVCMSTSHIAYMAALGLEDKIVGISGTKYISDESILSRIKSGEILDIGYEGSLNFELVMRLRPDIVFTYGIAGENNIYVDKIRDLGIKVIALGDYLEEHPIGKLEYIKLFGKLFDCNNKADSIYNSVKTRYFFLKQIAIHVTYRPKVLLNAPWKEVWFIPGYENYMSVLIRDAGGEPILSKIAESKTSSYSLEEVYKNSMTADFWLNPNNYSSIDELKNVNPLFANIPSLKNRKIYNNIKRRTANGGSDFWERGVIEPDVILNDLISIIHPELNAKRELIYYMKLE